MQPTNPNQQSWYSLQQQLAQAQQQQQLLAQQAAQQAASQQQQAQQLPQYAPRPAPSAFTGSFTAPQGFTSFQQPQTQQIPTLQQQLNQFPQVGRPPSTSPAPASSSLQEVAKAKPVVVKLYLEPGNHVRRFALPSLDITLEQFLNGKVKTIVDKKKKFAALDAKRVNHYKDDEDEWVRIEDEEEWQECLRLVKYQQISKDEKKPAALLKFRITVSVPPKQEKGKGPLVAPQEPMEDLAPLTPVSVPAPAPVPMAMPPQQSFDFFKPVQQSPSPSPFNGSSQPTAPQQPTNPAPLAAANYKCDSCSEAIEGNRHHCLHCQDYDLCRKCYNNRFTFHDSAHAFETYDSQDKLVPNSSPSPQLPKAFELNPQFSQPQVPVQPTQPMQPYPFTFQTQPQQPPQQFPGFPGYPQQSPLMFGSPQPQVQPQPQQPQVPQVAPQDPALEQFMNAARTMGLDEGKMRPLFDKHKGNFEQAVHEYLNYN